MFLMAVAVSQPRPRRPNQSNHAHRDIGLHISRALKADTLAIESQPGWLPNVSTQSQCTTPTDSQTCLLNPDARIQLTPKRVCSIPMHDSNGPPNVSTRF